MAMALRPPSSPSLGLLARALCGAQAASLVSDGCCVRAARWLRARVLRARGLLELKTLMGGLVNSMGSGPACRLRHAAAIPPREGRLVLYCGRRCGRARRVPDVCVVGGVSVRRAGRRCAARTCRDVAWLAQAPQECLCLVGSRAPLPVPRLRFAHRVLGALGARSGRSLGPPRCSGSVSLLVAVPVLLTLARSTLAMDPDLSEKLVGPRPWIGCTLRGSGWHGRVGEATHMNVHVGIPARQLPQRAVSYMTAGRGFPDPTYTTR